jgi:teichuronic acid exporter
MPGLRQKTLSGLKWSAFDRVLSQGINFIIALIIARILKPSDYGVVGMLAIFLSLSQVFIDGGFGASIVKKQGRTDADFSTVFYYNILTGFIFYALLFLLAPFISEFYHTPILVPVTRILGLNILINAFGSVQKTRLTIQVDFKTQAKISIIALVISGTAGIFAAIRGYGVWALVFQSLISSFITTFLLWVFIKWRPKFLFSRSSFRELFGFGSKLMLSGLIDSIYSNIYQLVIGKHYSASDLGFYSRANGMAQMPANNANVIIQRVTFPVLSEIQDESARLSWNYRRVLKMSVFMLFPIMTIMIALGDPLIRILLTDKWIPSLPLFQILCISYMFYPVQSLNLNLLKVKGRSDLFLKLEIVKKSLLSIVLIISFPLGIKAICIGAVITSVMALAINSFYTGKILNIGFYRQMKDISPVFLISSIGGLTAYLPSLFFDNVLIRIILGGLAGLIVYIAGSYFLQREELNTIIEIIQKKKILNPEN